MTIEVKEPNTLEKYVDQNGRLTIEGQKLLQQVVRALADHEARITVLEP